MLAPINEYYTYEDYAYALKLMRKMIERQRIATIARLANSQRNSLKKEFKNKVKTTANHTKESIQIIEGQLDTAIRGTVRDKLEQVVKNKLPEYTKIVS
ncbi:hypothetical protein MKL26_07805 [Streptococcus suis]|nr:hypothetical protein [Streptococcus suis]